MDPERGPAADRLTYPASASRGTVLFRRVGRGSSPGSVRGRRSRSAAATLRRPDATSTPTRSSTRASSHRPPRVANADGESPRAASQASGRSGTLQAYHGPPALPWARPQARQTEQLHEPSEADEVEQVARVHHAKRKHSACQPEDGHQRDAALNARAEPASTRKFSVRSSAPVTRGRSATRS